MITRFKEFINDLIQKQCTYFIIEPLPKPKKQVGPTCGYYASSYVTNFYALSHQAYSTWPARKKDISKATESYRQRGKVANIEGIGSIWDVAQFSLFLPECQVNISSFETEKEMSKILLSNLHLNKPIVMPVDVPGNALGTDGGTHPHYITIVGYYRQPEECLYYIYNSWSSYYICSAGSLFESCNNLKEYPGGTYYKYPSSVSWTKYLPPQPGLSQDNEPIQVYEIPKMDLSNLRNHCVLIQPKNFDKNIHYSKALKNELSKDYINYNVIKALWDTGINFPDETSPKLIKKLKANVGVQELKEVIQLINYERSLVNKELNSASQLSALFDSSEATEEELTPKNFSESLEEQFPLEEMIEEISESNPSSLYSSAQTLFPTFKPNAAMIHVLYELEDVITVAHFRDGLSPLLHDQFTHAHAEALIYLIKEGKLAPFEALFQIRKRDEQQIKDEILTVYCPSRLAKLIK